MAQQQRLFIGTSGWSYASWRGRFYPEKLPAGRWLEHYARVFDAVELNASFYRLPKRELVARWAAVTLSTSASRSRSGGRSPISTASSRASISSRPSSPASNP